MDSYTKRPIPESKVNGKSLKDYLVCDKNPIPLPDGSIKRQCGLYTKGDEMTYCPIKVNERCPYD